MSGAYLLAGMGGAALGSLLLSHHVYLLNGLSILGYAITAWIALLIPRQAGMEYEKVASDVLPIPVSDDATKDEDLDVPHLLSDSSGLSLDSESLQSLIQRRPVEKDAPRPLLHILLHTWHASYTSLLTLFSPPNPTFTVILLFLINSLAQHIQVLLPQYTSLLLSWPLERVNAALALKNLVSALFLFLLPTFRKTYLQPRLSTPLIDLLISQASLLANTLGLIGLALSPSSTSIPFILSLSLYTSGVGLPDSLTAYGTLSLPQGETVPDFYTRTGLANTLAGLLGGPLWSGMFGLVQSSGFLPMSLPMWSCAVLFGVGFVMVGQLRKWFLRDGGAGTV